MFAGYQTISPLTKSPPRIELSLIVFISPNHTRTQQMKRAFMNGKFTLHRYFIMISQRKWLVVLTGSLSNRELKMETFSGRRQLQPDVTSGFVRYCACSCSPHCRRAPVGDVKLVCLALWREREYLTLISDLNVRILEGSDGYLCSRIALPVR